MDALRGVSGNSPKPVPVELRPLELEDAAAIVHWREDPAVERFLNPHDRSLEMVRELIKRAQPADPWTLRGIWLEGRLIGYCSIDDLDTMIGKAQLGIIIGEPDCWGRGIGKHVMALLLAHCFEKLKLHRALAIVARGNERSSGLFESLGFVHEGTLREATLVGNVRTDLLCYSLLAHEYEANRTPRGWLRLPPSNEER